VGQVTETELKQGRQAMNINYTALFFPCDKCGKQIDVLHLLKGRDQRGVIIRRWVCHSCWENEQQNSPSNNPRVAIGGKRHDEWI
jgi:hypothetical protein